MKVKAALVACLLLTGCTHYSLPYRHRAAPTPPATPEPDPSTFTVYTSLEEYEAAKCRREPAANRDLRRLHEIIQKETK